MLCKITFPKHWIDHSRRTGAGYFALGTLSRNGRMELNVEVDSDTVERLFNFANMLKSHSPAEAFAFAWPDAASHEPTPALTTGAAPPVKTTGRPAHGSSRDGAGPE